jgi:hypothetical protein
VPRAAPCADALRVPAFLRYRPGKPHALKAGHLTPPHFRARGTQTGRHECREADVGCDQQFAGTTARRGSGRNRRSRAAGTDGGPVRSLRGTAIARSQGGWAPAAGRPRPILEALEPAGIGGQDRPGGYRIEDKP